MQTMQSIIPFGAMRLPSCTMLVAPHNIPLKFVFVYEREPSNTIVFATADASAADCLRSLGTHASSHRRAPRVRISYR